MCSWLRICMWPSEIRRDMGCFMGYRSGGDLWLSTRVIVRILRGGTGSMCMGARVKWKDRRYGSGESVDLIS